MLDKSDRYYLAGQDVASAIATLQGALYSAGIPLAQVGPNQWSGRGQVGSYSMVPKVMVTTLPAQDGFFLDSRITPDFEGNGLVLFIVAWLFFFPVAIILAFMAYQDWQTRQTQLSQLMWAPLAPRIAQPPGQPWGPPAMPGQPGGWPR